MLELYRKEQGKYADLSAISLVSYISITCYSYRGSWGSPETKTLNEETLGTHICMSRKGPEFSTIVARDTGLVVGCFRKYGCLIRNWT